MTTILTNHQMTGMEMDTPKKNYSKPHERPPKAQPLPIERKRHIEIVDFVREVRTATRDQIQRYLGLQYTTAQGYLTELNQHHYLYPLRMPTETDGRNPAVYILDTNGIKLLERLGYTNIYHPKKTLSPFKLPHYIGLTETYLKIRKGIEAIGGEIVASYPEHLHQAEYDFVPVKGYRKPVSLKPDWGYLVRLPNKRVTFLFVEFDRSSENLNTIALKAECYISALQNQLFKKRYSYKGFRVLFVIDSPGIHYKLRPQNVLDKLSGLAGIQRRFWVTSYEDFCASQNVMTDPIWSIAGDVTGASIVTPNDFILDDKGTQ